MLLSVGVTLRAQVVVDAVREDLLVLGGGAGAHAGKPALVPLRAPRVCVGETVSIPYTTLVWLACL